MIRAGVVSVTLLTVLVAALADVRITVHWTHENGTNLELAAEDFARMAEEHRAGLQGQGHNITKRNAVTDYKYLWYMGTVYYDIDARTVDFRLIQMLANAFQFFQKYTCIRWRRRIPGDGVQNYVVFTMPYGGIRLCNSAVGRQTGRQYVNLDRECLKSLAQVLHQMTHALGFYHTHTRADRDKYVSVYPNNARPENRKFFNIEAPGVADAMGFPYEHKSLMHFASNKYAIGNSETIKSKIPGVKLGNDGALTVQDITMINTLYAQCKRSCRFNNGQCEQTCYDEKPGVVTCSCLQGYRLNNDAKTCYDNDECTEHNGGCDQQCITQGVWYRCACNTGYSLDKNGYSCRANNLCDDGTLKCEQGCFFNKCTCEKGFVLNSDGLHCDDINECHHKNGGCDGSCTNTVGSYKCGCQKGQYLTNDGMSCTNIVCTLPVDIPNIVYTCTNENMVENTECHYTCKQGFKLQGNNMMVCRSGQWSTTPPQCIATDRCQLDNGGCEQQCWANTWDDVRCSCRVGYKLADDKKACIDIEPPTILECPKDIYADTVPEKGFASVTWDLPRFHDNVKAKIVSGPVMQDKIGGVYDIGSHSVDYIMADASGNEAHCTFKIKVTDREAPDMFNCPTERTYEISPTQKYLKVDWKDPAFWDNSDNVKVTTDLPADRRIQPRTQEIHYIAGDPSGNSVVCTVKVNIKVKEESCDTFPLAPVDGYMQCDQFSFGSQCRAECNNGYDLRNNGAPDYYTCQKNVWIPTPRQLTCPGSKAPLKAPVLYYQIKYKNDCEYKDLSQLQTYAVRTAKKYKTLLCPATKGGCDMTATHSCTSEGVTLNIYTTDPLSATVKANRYLSQISTNVLKSQKAARFFFYMPIAGSILAPETMSLGLQVVPKIDFVCQPGDVQDTTRLKCYGKSRAAVLG